MKYSTLSEKRQFVIRHEMALDVDIDDNIIFIGTPKLVPDLSIHNFFMFKNV
jgi:hypothetical protein